MTPVLAFAIPIGIMAGQSAFTRAALDESNDTVYNSKFGVAFQGIVGKEWWVSSEWGLGIALEGIVAAGMKDKNDSSVTWSGRGINLLFSATSN